jgi:hypothetical protein
MALPKRDSKMSNDERIAVLETTINHIDASLMSLNQDNKAIVEMIRLLNDKFDARFDKLSDRIWSSFLWMIAGFASVLGIIAHALHWI